MTNTKQGFTMIELIFVITIIGILAAVAIPKLAANMTDTQSALCSNEIGQFLSNAAMVYTANGYSKFKNLKASDMTNIRILFVVTDGDNGFIDTKVDTVGANYYCDGEKVINFRGSVENNNYNLTLTLEDTTSINSPVATQTIKKVRDHLLGGLYIRTYSL